MEQPQSGSGPIWWSVLLATGCVVIVVYAIFNPPLEPEGIAYAIGMGLGGGLIAAFLFTALFGRFWPGRWSIAFAAFFVSVTTASVVGSESARSNVRKVVTSTSQSFSTLLDADGTTRLQRIDSSPSASGGWAHVEALVRSDLNNQIDQYNEYIASLDAIGWQTILDAERIQQDQDFSETRQTIQQARRLVQKYEEMNWDRADDLLQRVRQLPLDREELDRVVRGYEAGFAKSKPAAQETWRLEAAVVEDISAVTEILHSSRGRWWIEDNQVLFDNDSDLEEYNGAIERMQATVASQERIAQEIQADMDEYVREMEALLKQR